MTGELFQQSTSQLSFDKFISTINKEQAKDLVKSINIFMKNFRKSPVNSEADSHEVQEFLAGMEAAFARHPLWAGCAQEELDSAVEGLEKYLMTKLHDRTFGQDEADRERDNTLTARLAALQFVRPEHLEISHDFEGDSSLVLAQKELKKLNAFKCPREKLICMLNCCKVINNLLSSRKYGAGADDFTPVLIYVTIKAQPDMLASNLAFIERYRLASRLVAEASYFFVQMQGAASFIETLNTASLKVDPDELIAHMLAAGAMSEADLGMLHQQQLTTAAGAAGVHAYAHAQPSTSPPAPPPATAPQQAGPQSPRSAAVAAASAASVAFAQEPSTGNGESMHHSTPPQPLPQPVLYHQPLATVPPPPAQMHCQPYHNTALHAAQPLLTLSDEDTLLRPAQASHDMPHPPGPALHYERLSRQLDSHCVPSPPPPTTHRAVQSVPPPPEAPQPPIPRSVAELESEGLALLLQAEAAGELQARYRYLYASAESLSMREVRQLLGQYKELVLKYELLAQAVEHSVLQYYSEQEAFSSHTHSDKAALPTSAQEAQPADASYWVPAGHLHDSVTGSGSVVGPPGGHVQGGQSQHAGDVSLCPSQSSGTAGAANVQVGTSSAWDRQQQQQQDPQQLYRQDPPPPPQQQPGRHRAEQLASAQPLPPTLPLPPSSTCYQGSVSLHASDSATICSLEQSQQWEADCVCRPP